jgi:hypothetical protein
MPRGSSASPSPLPSCLALGCKHRQNKFRFPGNIYLRPCGDRVHWPHCVLPAGCPGAGGQEARGLGRCGGQSVGLGRAREDGRALSSLLES